MKSLKWYALVVGIAALWSAGALASATQESKTPAAKGASAAQSAQRGQARGARAARPEALSGTIAAYDASASAVTVKTATGDQTVAVDSNTRIREGSKTLKPGDLSSLTGRNVKVRYRESGGKLIATQITVAPAGK